MVVQNRGPVALLVLHLFVTQADAFAVVDPPATTARCTSTTRLAMAAQQPHDDRRSFLSRAVTNLGSGLLIATSSQPASATVYLDPAMYGDQELRSSAVDSLKESVRRASLQNPGLAPAFYQLALLDGLSYDAATKEYGPDGRVVKAVLSSKDDSLYMKNLKEAANTLLASTVALKKLTSITVADAVALGGAEAIESIGGPVMSVQLGRTDADKSAKVSPLNLDILSGTVPPDQVVAAFKRSGLTEREMTALLGGLLTLDLVPKTVAGDWKKSAKAKYRERGKIGRMSEFKRLTDEDIAEMEEDDEEEGGFLGGEDPYIADSFGSRDEAYGQKVSQGVTTNTFNKYIKDLDALTSKKGGSSAGDVSNFGWIGAVLLDKNSPTTEAWLNKYASSYLNYNKDLNIAYSAITQLGAEYTGGKYESLLKNKPRKTLNDDDLGLGF